MFNNPHVKSQKALTEQVYKYYNNKKNDRNLLQATDGCVFHHFGLGPTEIDLNTASDNDIINEIQRQEHELTTKLIELLDYNDNPTKTLDIACGRGGNLVRIAAEFPNAKLEGINICDYQVAFCEEVMKKKSIDDRVKLTLGNFLEMPFDNESFSHAFCCEVTQYTTNLNSLLKEINRVMEERGTLVIFTWCYDENKNQSELKEIIEPINDHYASTMHSFQQYKKSFSESGFNLISEEDVTERLIPYWELREQWSLKSGIEPNFLKGHREGYLLYKLFVLQK